MANTDIGEKLVWNFESHSLNSITKLCHLCDKVFSNTSCLNRHIRKVHEKSKKHKCNFCEDKCFFALYELHRHNKVFHKKYLPESEKLRKQETTIPQKSGDESKKKSTSQQQTLIQISIKNLTDGKCEHCEETFEDPEKLFSHLEIPDHEYEGHVFKCCNIKSQNAKEVIDHIRMTHYRNHKCEHCNESFFTYEHLEEHRFRYHHKNECKICNNKFSSAEDLNNHTKYFHEISENYKCDLCNSLFTKFIDLKMHKDCVHKEKKKCDFCNKLFVNNSSLNRHVKALHTKEPKSYECSFCDKKFFQSQELKRHKWVHEERIDSYKCDICDKTYLSNDTLRHHVKTIHEKITNKKEYKCEKCNKIFVGRIDSLKRHMKFVHSMCLCQGCTQARLMLKP